MNVNSYDPNAQPGGATSVAGTQGANPTSSGISGTFQSIFGQAPAVTGPNTAAYNSILQQGEESAAIAGAMTPQQAAAAQIANPFQAQSQAALSGTGQNINAVAGLLGQTAVGQGPAAQAAQAQMAQATGQSIAAQEAMARSATGGALSQNAAQLAGQQNIAQTTGQAAAASQQTMAQMENQAAQAAGQLYGTGGQLQLGQYNTEQQNAQLQAQLAQQQQIANMQSANQFNLGTLGAQQNAIGLQGQTLNAYTGQNLAAQGLQGQQNATAFSQGMQVAGGVLSGGASMIGQAALQPLSDERLKTGIQSEGNMADDFLSTLHPESYHYASPENEPRPDPNGGRYLGVIAQDMEKSPAGKQAVTETPKGKAIAGGAGLSAALAGLGRLNERVKELEMHFHGS